MKRIYFIRHGEPDFPEGKTMCLGSTDLHLSLLGRLQAVLAAEHLKGTPNIRLFSSPLARAVQTAQSFRLPITTLPGLREREMGIWEGLTFDEIQIKYPQLYEARGIDPMLAVPGQEEEQKALLRFQEAVFQGVRLAGSDTPVFVAHSGVLKLFIREFAPLPRPAYGCVIPVDTDGMRFYGAGEPQQPRPPLTPDLCQKLLQGIFTPPGIVKHCRAVSAKAAELTDHLADAGVTLNRALIISAAYLHDLMRTEPNHGEAAGAIMTRLGYGEIGETISLHHDPKVAANLDEAAIVYLADKLILEHFPVSISQRFEESGKKCKTPEQKELHKARYHAARSLAERINALCGKTVAEL